MSNFYSPELEPGHFSNPALKARGKLLNEYNAAINEARKGLYDLSGYRAKSSEKQLIQIYTGGIRMLASADTLELVQAISAKIEKQVQQATEFIKAA